MSGIKPGAFRVRNDPPNQHYRVAIEIAYDDQARPDVIHRELTEAYALALAELDKRLPQQAPDPAPARPRPATTPGGKHRGT